MVAVALLSAKGSPGATTSALALSAVWPEVHSHRRVLLAECDAAGGDIASGYLRGALDASRGVLGLAVQRGLDPVEAVCEQVLALDEDHRRLLLPGLTDPTRAPLVSSAWSTVAAALQGLSELTPPIDVLLDLGRMRTAHEPILLRQRADIALLVCCSTLPAIVAARAAAAELRAQDGGDASLLVAALVIGRGPYKAIEISAALDLPIIGILPYDALSAAVFSSGATPGRRFSRSPLIRAARTLATGLMDGLHDEGPNVTAAPALGVERA